MLAPIDTHVHLLAGLDDGPPNVEIAVAMCRMLVAEGVRTAVALAHQNDSYPENTPSALIEATAQLERLLQDEQIPLKVVPAGEVMLSTEFIDRVKAGDYLTVANRGQYLLVEQPHGVFLDVRPYAVGLRPLGMRLILAHAERYPELLHDDAYTRELISLGCLVQVTPRVLAQPGSLEDERRLRTWVTQGYVHLVGSDGHGIDRRLPRLQDGMGVIHRWAGPGTVDRVGNIWASSILHGRMINPPAPQVAKQGWFQKWLSR